ncbi:MAG: hypothetical protein LBV72_13450 [Tannerella sp.]|jgi:hypothetical protein|nr:hypothetical protein [Tannerella sp.]
MSTNKQKIQVDKQEIEFSREENLWFCQLKKDYDQIEASIDTEKYCSEIDWSKIRDFFIHFKQNKEKYIEICYAPLKMLAKTTTFFSDEQIQDGEFAISGIEILDNQHSLENKWEFELQFELLDSDPYGLWTVTFQCNCIVGIRREQL